MNQLRGIVFVLCFVSMACANHLEAQELIRFKNQRAKEDYSFLQDSLNLRWKDAMKYLPLNASRSAYLSIGGSVRSRYEYIDNRFWLPENNESYYSQRLALHTDWHLGKNVRLFGELQSAYQSNGDVPLQSDDVDVHQAFIEFKNNASNLSFRLGRQELKFGVGRLVDFGLGPNVRRTFDIGKVTFSYPNVTIDAYYGKEVPLRFGAFDNSFDLFRDSDNQKVWGVYSQFPLLSGEDKTPNAELYYLGIQSDRSAFSDVAGGETRHSTGVRFFGVMNKRFTYNTEFIYQFGELGTSSIRAFNVETDWKYLIKRQGLRPTLGLKLDWSSGDQNLNDGRVGSFNPMYVNPSIYSLALINVPVNLLSLHPSFTVFPSRKLMVQVEYVVFGRSSKNDGLYAPSNRQSRTAADGVSARHIGNSVGLFVVYNYNRSFSFNLRTSYFQAGDFIEQTGPSESVFQFSPTLTFSF